MSERRDFWSRRKAAVRSEQEAEQAKSMLSDAADVSADVSDGADMAEDLRSDEEILTEAGFSEPETCQNAQELREFLKSDLPQRFKIRALRHLWRLNPVLANLDGLVDYGGDYTDAANVVENLQTVYKAGRGMLDRIAELEEEREKKRAGESLERVTENAPEIAPENSADTSSHSKGRVVQADDKVHSNANHLERIDTSMHSEVVGSLPELSNDLESKGFLSDNPMNDGPADYREAAGQSVGVRRMRFRFD